MTLLEVFPAAVANSKQLKKIWHAHHGKTINTRNATTPIFFIFGAITFIYFLDTAIYNRYNSYKLSSGNLLLMRDFQWPQHSQPVPLVRVSRSISTSVSTCSEMDSKLEPDDTKLRLFGKSRRRAFSVLSGLMVTKADPPPEECESLRRIRREGRGAKAELALLRSSSSSSASHKASFTALADRPKNISEVS